MAVRADDVDLIRDRSLVELCQAGDDRAFGDLYTRYYQRLLRFCIRRVGNVHEAEEITQEAFARAFMALPRFAGERRFYPWLTVIASRLCVDSHRRGARSEPSADVDLGTVDGGQQQIIDNVDLAYLAQAMSQLGPRHREVLELREMHALSYQQIADHYNVTLGTVEALLFRARKALRREFLSLVGDDGRLAGIPVLGVIWRLSSGWRTRVQHASSQLAPLAAASAMSVAAAAGGFSVASSPNEATVPKAIRAPTAAVARVAPDLVAPSTQPEQVTASPMSRVEPAARRADATPAIEHGTAADGRERTKNDRSTVNIAGVSISTDIADGILGEAEAR